MSLQRVRTAAGVGFVLILFVVVGPVRGAVDFENEVRPILETTCVSCHCEANAEGDLRLDSLAGALAEGENGPCLVPGKAAKSSLYARTLLPADNEERMPPEGPALSSEQTEILRKWIDEGARWPEGVVLKARPRKVSAPPSPDNLELVRRIHAKIVARAKEEAGEMANYSSKVPETGAKYHMVAVPGGKFTMGSPEDEPGRQPNEGPQTSVEVEPFWLGQYEVTWDEYEPFMITRVDRYKNGARKDFDPKVHSDIDAVTSPTPPYVEMSFGMGQRGYPAISMTQHGANKYCEWLSAQTGHFYRLPTEAEWEYACRAGTTTAYSFGDDPAGLGAYAWYYENSEDKYQKVGTKKPNPWGLYDMHGNVAEWTADQYVADYFSQLAQPAVNPFVRPSSLYPRCVRGGGWESDPEPLRSAARRGSEPSWQQQDPQLPKSVWYLTDAPWLGFRLARPKKIPSAEEMYFYWNSSTDKL
ncbi:MAG: SUMF1/EgtB/PvdO family nonheme iron enzyme [Pirellulales bacterium]|nr:SUMF1/EgtB/PvdO family nonheme iron enzyme [Pirellulales bacterium]